MVCLSEGRRSHGLVFGPGHVEARGIVGRRAVRVNRKQRGTRQSPHEGGTLFLEPSCSDADLVRAPTERAESQRNFATDSLQLSLNFSEFVDG